MTESPAVVLMEYYGVGQALVCWAWRTGMLAPQLVPVDVELAQLRALVETAPWLQGAPDAAQEDILAALVAPAVQFAREGDLLWIVPWGPLHQLPMHAATLPDGRVLLERHPVVYSPSASVMGVCRARRRGEFKRALVLGDAEGDLPDARLEAEAAAARFGAPALIGPAATAEALDAALAAAGDDLDVLLQVGAVGLAEDAPWLAAAYAVGSVVIGLLAAAAGLHWGRRRDAA